jgi:hypothetical protein
MTNQPLRQARGAFELIGVEDSQPADTRALMMCAAKAPPAEHSPLSTNHTRVREREAVSSPGPAPLREI